MRFLSCITFQFICFGLLQGQGFYYSKTNDFYQITPATPDSIVHQFLKQEKAIDIRFDEWNDEGYMLKNKRDKWSLFVYNKLVNKKPYDTIRFPFYTNSEAMYAYVGNKSKYGVLQIASGKVRHWYSALSLYHPNEFNYFLAEEGNKWGVISVEPNEIVFPFIYKQQADVPNIHLSNYHLSSFKVLRDSVGADVVLPDPNNGDGIYKARIAKTQKWGLFQVMNKVHVLVPAQYDSLVFFDFNGVVIPVHNNGKVGFYTWDEKGQTVPCMYDAYKKLIYQRSNTTFEKFHMAVMQNGKWGIVDWYTGDLLVACTYNSPQEIPLPREDSAYYAY